MTDNQKLVNLCQNDLERLAEPANAIRRWPMFAYDCGHGKDCGRYKHIGARHWVELHGLPHPIVAVDVIEDAAGNYWGWLATDTECPTMIWPSYSLFSMCFTYGPEAEVQRGKGVILRLRVEAPNMDEYQST